MEYLESKLDTEDGTGCLRIIHGDWNDAMDGLGKTDDPGKQYGTGVSVMASLHFYQNLTEMICILKKIGGYQEQISHYQEVQEALKASIIKHAVISNDKGEKRILHGWGDHGSYQIGSFCDCDGKSRISYAPNAFWVTSGIISETPELRELILDTIKKLDSRFGLRTLTPAFLPDAIGAGRIANTTPGTAENDCVYVHATMFSVLALFGLGEPEYAWEQYIKVLPIMQPQITKTPFVMSNSYLDNEEREYRGQSVIDWYTGAGTVFLKNLVRCVLGVNPSVDGVVFKPAKELPCQKMHADMDLKGYRIRLEYENKGLGERRIYLGEQELPTVYDDISKAKAAFAATADLYDGAVIKICD